MSEPSNITVSSSSQWGSFIRDILKLVSGTTIAQLLVVLASPILTRLYGPDAFGLLAVFTSFTSILATNVCLRYELSIVLPESDGEAANLLFFSLGVAVLIGLLTVPIFHFGGPILSQWLNAPELNRYLWLVSLILVFGGLGMGHPALNYWATRMRRFKELSITRVIGVAITVSGQLFAGFAGFVSASGLIGASVVGSMISPLILAVLTWREDGKLFLQSIKWREMLAGIKRHRKFPLFSTWSSFLNNISWQLPVFLLSAFFPTEVVGYYYLGFRILQMPLNLLGDAISNVFFQRAVEAKEQGTLAVLVEEVFRQLVTISLFPILILSIIGQDLFIIVFGQDWAEAGLYLQILSIWAFFWFISGPFSTLFAVMEKQEIQFNWNILTLIIRFLSLGIGGILHDAHLAIFLFSFTGVFVYGYKVYINFMLSGVSIQKSFSVLAKVFLKYLPVTCVVLVVSLIASNKFWVLGVATIMLIVHMIISLRGMKSVKVF
jgi:lipopolysaccharide exporter